jgi:acyl CoA:acetate/3-ketoacid CoA transferase beta subunit
VMPMTTVFSEKRALVYTPGELMVASAAREIRDGEVVFVGMRLPLIAFVVAKKTHAPNAVGLFENGVIRTTPSPELIYTMADPANLMNATQCLDMLGVMSLLQSGRVHLGFLGAAEVDRFGNLNSTEVHGAKGVTRLPGSGGACDIASLAHRFPARTQQGALARTRCLHHKSGKRRWVRLAEGSRLDSRWTGRGDHQQGGASVRRRW